MGMWEKLKEEERVELWIEQALALHIYFSPEQEEWLKTRVNINRIKEWHGRGHRRWLYERYGDPYSWPVESYLY